jgi:hypothetical protein
MSSCWSGNYVSPWLSFASIAISTSSKWDMLYQPDQEPVRYRMSVKSASFFDSSSGDTYTNVSKGTPRNFFFPSASSHGFGWKLTSDHERIS